MTDALDANPPATLLEALARIRKRAEAHMDGQDLAGLGWSEETITEIAIGAGIPFVKPVPFNRHQESMVGADWLWWWLDTSSEECFGMLVQAKRLKRERDRWRLDISHGNGSQRRRLMETATHFDVPAIYGVYTGGPVFRKDLACPHRSVAPCRACIRMAITLMPALSLSPVWDQDVLADLTLAEGVPLEDLGDSTKSAGPVRDVNFRELPLGELRDFLLEDQAGPREVAKHIFKAVSTRRSGQHSAAVAERVELVGEQVFDELPRDKGHFPEAYYPHVLRGLRRNWPDYVRDLMAGFSPPLELPSRVAGVVLVVD
jgi:hypothetical protein